MQLLYTAAYLFTYYCLLLPIICVAVFYAYLFISLVSHFQSHHSPMPTHSRLFSESPTFGGTQHYLQSDVFFILQGSAVTFLRVVGKGVTVCFLPRYAIHK